MRDVPVLVVDLTDAEADKLLAVHDPLAALAEADPTALADLLRNVHTSNAAVQALLAKLRAHVAPRTVYSPSELREVLGITRKWLIPFLEWCDRQRISLRSADGRTFGTIPENP